jgi:hypothetical protein
MNKFLLTLAAIFGAQGVMVWFFYRSRTVFHAHWTASDLVVFGLPPLVGFTVAFFVIFFCFPQKRITTTLGFSIIGAWTSSLFGTMIAFFMYGP